MYLLLLNLSYYFRCFEQFCNFNKGILYVFLLIMAALVFENYRYSLQLIQLLINFVNPFTFVFLTKSVIFNYNFIFIFRTRTLHPVSWLLTDLLKNSFPFFTNITDWERYILKITILSYLKDSSLKKVVCICLCLVYS